MQHWYALRTKPHREYQVESVLKQRGVEVYFPTVPAPRRGRPSAERAFFPCYVFAYADLETVGLWTLHYAPGVRGVVMFGGVPARVHEQVITALRSRLANVDLVDTYGKVLEPGDPVLITEGPLAEWDAVFDRRLSAAGRVRVLVQLLERWTSVEMDVHALRKTTGLPRRDLVNPKAAGPSS